MPRSVQSALFAILLAFSPWLGATTARAANCAASDISLFSVSPANMGNYSPYAPAPLAGSFTVTISSPANCTNLYLGVSAAGGNFAPTAAGLTYALTGSVPVPGSEIKINVNRTTVTRSFALRIAPGQLAPVGYHSSLNAPPIRVNLYLKDRWLPFNSPVRSQVLDVNVTVPPACQLPAPNLSTVDFSAALTSGLPNPAIVRSVVFSGASCLAPTRVRISGAALLPVTPLPPRPGFDSLINWQAQATFGLASTTLVTAGPLPAQATSTTRIASGSGTTSGNITVNINLVAGTRPLSGNYGGVLTLTIDPAL
jgi:hypothetical protein